MAAKANGWMSTAFGSNTLASGFQATSFGADTKANGENALAFGYWTQANGRNSTAFGHASTAEGENATAFGSLSNAKGINSLAALGGITEEGAKGATAIGVEATAKLENSIALGNGAVADRAAGVAGYAFGKSGVAVPEGIAWTSTAAAISVGSGTVTRQITGVAAGSEDTDAVNLAQLKKAVEGISAGGSTGGTDVYTNKAELGTDKKLTFTRSDGETYDVDLSSLGGGGSTAGGTVFVNGTDVTIGADKNASAWGQSTKASGVRTTAFGINTEATGANATVWGMAAKATGQNATAFGGSTVASGFQATAFGASSKAEGMNSLAFGSMTQAIGMQATAFGLLSIAEGDNATAFGMQSKAIGNYSTAFGQSAKADGENSLAALGGTTEEDATGSVAIGVGATAKLENSIALGNGAVADRAAGVAGYAFGKSGVAVPEGIAWTSTAAAISVGSGTVTRQITGVAAGSEDTDAVNLAQLKKAVEGISAGGSTGGQNTFTTGVTVDGNKVTFNRNDGGSYSFNLPSNTGGGQSGSVVVDGKIEKDNKGALSGGAVFTETRIDVDGAYVKKDQSVARNVQILDKTVDAQAKNIKTITNSMNVLQVRVGDLDNRINKVGAGAAALAALRPMDLGNNKWSIAAGFGNYQNASAGALGVFYRPMDNFLFSMSGTFGGEANMVNAGVSFAVGAGEAKGGYNLNSILRENEVMKEHIARQHIEIEALKEAIARLETQIRK